MKFVKSKWHSHQKFHRSIFLVMVVLAFRSLCSTSSLCSDQKYWWTVVSHPKKERSRWRSVAYLANHTRKERRKGKEGERERKQKTTARAKGRREVPRCRTMEGILGVGREKVKSGGRWKGATKRGRKEEREKGKKGTLSK